MNNKSTREMLDEIGDPFKTGILRESVQKAGESIPEYRKRALKVLEELDREILHGPFREL
jgi:hypothetical protein